MQELEKQTESHWEESNFLQRVTSQNETIIMWPFLDSKSYNVSDYAKKIAFNKSSFESSFRSEKTTFWPVPGILTTQIFEFKKNRTCQILK